MCKKSHFLAIERDSYGRTRVLDETIRPRHRHRKTTIKNQVVNYAHGLDLFLGIDKVHLIAIISRPHGEVQPYRTVSILLYQQFVEILLAFISIIQ